jgi:predicted helicase
MAKAKIFYFTLTDEMRRKEKLDWFSENKFKNIPFEHIRPDKNNNWIELSEDNDWEEMIQIASKYVKSGKSKEALFELFSLGASTNRDEWVIDISKDALVKKSIFLSNHINNLNEKNNSFDLIIKWSRNLKRRIESGKREKYSLDKIKEIYYRPFVKFFVYDSELFIDEISLIRNIFRDENIAISTMGISSDKPFTLLISDKYTDLNYLSPAANGCRIFSLYRYTDCGNRLDNITDWGLEQFTNHYLNIGLGYRAEDIEKDSSATFSQSLNPKPQTPDPITKEDIFHYVYAVLHNPAYRKKYEINLKREFPRIPFYDDFRQWAEWGKKLMDLHINFETVEPFPLGREDLPWDKDRTPKAKLTADKQYGIITLDEQTSLIGIPKETWEYKLGNRSAVEWILDQYKEKTPKDPTIREKFNTYRFADYKEKVIDLIMRVTTVSIETMKIIKEMEKLS